MDKALLSDYPGVKGAHFLVTGGAGFIGSNIVEHLLHPTKSGDWNL